MASPNFLWHSPNNLTKLCTPHLEVLAILAGHSTIVTDRLFQYLDHLPTFRSYLLNWASVDYRKTC
ncbi:hypothetical protein B0H16DRAFT_1736572 [Mycena metata]|uniref:Uncharacterized protein n=1 Tax=Mycena metata TaxID=1033252 RepID=A0AAD7HPK6_9AGAR|nr:hypothetical protein B0H16DRAFT_1736572 [Mycena metata]